MNRTRTQHSGLANRYRTFAAYAARGNSPIYERLALGIAACPEVLAFLSTLPLDRRRPNLFLSAVRHVRGVPEDIDHLVEIVRQHHEAIREVMLSRSTQTNEPARCALLLPLLASLPQPLAVVEVGASAGLCLLPDRYGYDYEGRRIEPPVSLRDRSPVFHCEVTGAVPLPAKHPQIIWRVGLDLNPIDVRADDEVSWLETLVWPGADDRAAGLHAAVEIARLDPPRVVRGDLLTDLFPLLAEAPQNATLVVFHTGVLEYVESQNDRDRFVDAVSNSSAVWISNELPRVFPSFTQNVPPPRHGGFLTMLNGIPVAWSGPHGQSIDWFAQT